MIYTNTNTNTQVTLLRAVAPAGTAQSRVPFWRTDDQGDDLIDYGRTEPHSQGTPRADSRAG